MKTIIAAAAAAAMFAGAAYAQSATTYYVVRDAKTMKCTVVDKMPADQQSVMKEDRGNAVVYKSVQEAETGMKTIKACTM